MRADGRTITRSIVIEDELPFPPDAVWRALATQRLIRLWLMENDFEPVPGRRFVLQSWPRGQWDGVLHCEVLDIEPRARLVYSWTGGDPSDQGYAARIDSEVSWTLRPTHGGTWLKLEHAGFRSPENDATFVAMSCGWTRVLLRLRGVIAGMHTTH